MEIFNEDKRFFDCFDDLNLFKSLSVVVAYLIFPQMDLRKCNEKATFLKVVFACKGGGKVAEPDLVDGGADEKRGRAGGGGRLEDGPQDRQDAHSVPFRIS